MDARAYAMFTGLLSTLTKRQASDTASLLNKAAGESTAVDIIEKAAAETLACPRCRSQAHHRHAHASGLQRFRCTACSKTFHSLTGTPLARLRHKDKWLDCLGCLLDATTVRRAAVAVGVHKNTSFRWRHRFLTLPKTDRPLHLSGIAEADAIYFLESEKGARALERTPRKRGGSTKKRGTSNEHVCVRVARDRMENTLDFVTGRGPVSKAPLKLVCSLF